MAKAKKRATKKVVKRKIEKVRILPRKMSSLITIALKDLRKVEKDRAYVVEMGDWLNKSGEIVCTFNDAVVEERKVCSVCFAGAVMAFSLNGSSMSGIRITPGMFKGNEDQLTALDDLRTGDALTAYSRLKKRSEFFPENASEQAIERKLTSASLRQDIPDYDALHPEPFHRAMEKLRDRLKARGF